MDDDPPRAGAPLPGRRERRPHRLDDRPIEAGGGHHHHGVRAAHLEGKQPPGSIEVRLHDPPTDRPAAGEEDPVEVRMRDEPCRDVGASLHEVHDARRKPRAMEELDEPLTDRRRLLARLEDHGVPEEERRHEVTVRQVRREVEGSEHRHHPVRSEAADALDAGGRADGEVAHAVHHAVLEGDVHLRRDRGDLEPSLGEDLPHLATDEPRKILRALLHERLEPPQERHPLAERRRRPRGLRPSRRLDRAIDVLGARRAAPDDLLRSRRIPRAEPRALDRGPLAAEEVEGGDRSPAHAVVALPPRRRPPGALVGV